ncbi:MAG: TonB-dependent receptor [Deltaproteobacteria bacterium]|nr:TonB-dependent receptor [Deltaproteobacteria bacterium]
MLPFALLLAFQGFVYATENGPVEEEPEEITITAERPQTASSDQTIRDKDLKYFPRRTASDLMRLVPGLHITQHTGGAKAHQIFLRGFDAEHGQDILATIDGIPINEVSHVHGQGYLDLHFLIPEVVSQIRILKGPYDSRLGNFATAGSINFTSLASKPYRSSFRTGLGMFGTYSGMADLSLGSSDRAFYLALQGNRTDGFTDPGQLEAFRAFLRVHVKEQSGQTLDALYAGYRARSRAADILPASLIETGLIGRFEALDDSNRVDVDRHLVGLTFQGPLGQGRFMLRGYYNFKDTRIFSNYTFYYFNQRYGDQLEQSDFRHYGGLEAAYSFLSSINDQISLAQEYGIQYRSDAIFQTQANTVKRVRFNVMNNYRIGEHNLGIYTHQQLLLGERWILVGGLRYDLNAAWVSGTQDVKELDIYTNQVVIRNNLARDSVSAAHAISPKLSAVCSLSDEWQIFLNFGRGFVTRQARDQANKEELFAYAVNSLEISTRWSGWNKRLSIGLGVWWMHKDSELVFDSEFGGSVARGPSHRVGLELELRYQPISWVWLSTDFFFIHGRLDSESGWQPIPNAPSLMMTNIASLRHPGGYNATIRGRLLGPRRHDGGLESAAYYVLDLILAYETSRFEIAFEIENLLDSNWYDSIFAYPSRPEPSGPIDNGRQVTPGSPFALRVTLTYKI